MRLDKRGRRIGYNWWREYNCALLLEATLDWHATAEPITLGYTTETAEYKTDHPMPTLKAFLLGNKGMNREPDG